MEDIVTNQSLLDKIMAHFGWYKVKKVEFEFESLDITYSFNSKKPEPTFPVKPVLKRATTRKPKNGN